MDHLWSAAIYQAQSVDSMPERDCVDKIAVFLAAALDPTNRVDAARSCIPENYVRISRIYELQFILSGAPCGSGRR
jgi:hypothetical protein